MKKSIVVHSFLLLLLFLFMGDCGFSQATGIRTGNRNLSADYFPDKSVLKYAKGFSIEYHLTHKIIRVTNPWQDSKVVHTYVLVQKGTELPQNIETNKVIWIPTERIISLSTTNLPFIENLDLVDQLVGVGNTRLINNQKIRHRVQSDKIKEVGWTSNVDMEKLLILTPDLVITFGVGKSGLEELAIFDEFNVPYVTNTDYLEPTPLGRAEWIKFIAAFVNKEKLAEELFDKIEAGYLENSRLAETVRNKPSVFTGSNYKGSWRVPGGKSYLATMLSDAGASYIWADDNTRGSIPLDLETVFAKAWDADFWLNVGAWNSIQELKAADSHYNGFKSLERKTVYNNNARINQFGGNDYWESGLANPHLLLKDLIKIFHPHLLPDHKLNWYKRLE
ncbi:ABC transporter substrate-binding protein [bacterium]|nr:ABC transporter substrate-binding protein [bacterium]